MEMRTEMWMISGKQPIYFEVYAYISVKNCLLYTAYKTDRVLLMSKPVDSVFGTDLTVAMRLI